MTHHDFSNLSAAERGRATVRLLAAEGADPEQVFACVLDQFKILVIAGEQPDATTPIKKIEIQRHTNGELKSAVQTVTTKLKEHIDCVQAMADEMKRCYPTP